MYINTTYIIRRKRSNTKTIKSKLSNKSKNCIWIQPIIWRNRKWRIYIQNIRRNNSKNRWSNRKSYSNRIRKSIYNSNSKRNRRRNKSSNKRNRRKQKSRRKGSSRKFTFTSTKTRWNNLELGKQHKCNKYNRTNTNRKRKIQRNKRNRNTRRNNTNNNNRKRNRLKQHKRHSCRI